jgi:hypothetical protein
MSRTWNGRKGSYFDKSYGKKNNPEAIRSQCPGK